VYLQQINISNYKNYNGNGSRAQFSPRLNFLVGKNGAGKTNLLDAVYYLCFCKSYFSTTDAQNICHGQDFFRVEGCFDLANQPESIAVKFGVNRKKEFNRNGTVYERLSEHIGLLPLVMIAPDDIELVKGGSEERRKLLDTSISQFDKTYLEALIVYNRVLQQRNTLLKSFAERHYFNKQLLETYNEQLTPPANFIYQKRKEITQQLSPVIQQFYQNLSSGNETVACDYLSPLDGKDFADLLQQNLTADRQLQRTTEGVHRDDLEFTINKGYPIKKYGSQGQQKSFLIALKLAIFKLLTKTTGKTPILLLDDVFDKLDEQRTAQLVSIVSGEDFGQVFISDTIEHRMQAIFDKFAVPYLVFKINNGNIEATASKP